MRTCAPPRTLVAVGCAALWVALLACSRGGAERQKKAEPEPAASRGPGANVIIKTSAKAPVTRDAEGPAQVHAKPSEPASVAPKASLPAVNERAAEALATALRSVDEGSAAEAAAAGLAELEAERLPTFLTTALREYAEVSPSERSMVVSREVGGAEGQAAWGQACKGGVIVFQEVAVSDAGDKSRILYERCDLGRFGIFDAKTVSFADPAALLIAVMAADQLSRDGSLSEPEGYAIGKLGARPDVDAAGDGDAKLP